MNSSSQESGAGIGFSPSKRLIHTVLLAMLLTTVPFIIFIVFILSADSQKNESILRLKQAQFETTADLLIAMKNRRLKELITDTAFTATLAESGMKQKRGQSLIRPFGLNAAWLYNQENQKAWSETDSAVFDVFIPSKKVLEELNTTRELSGFIKLPSAIAEIAAVKVLLSGLSVSLEKRAYYLFIARLWNDEFQDNFAGVSSSKIEYHDLNAPYEPSQSETRVIRVLHDLEGKPISEMHWIRRNPFAEKYMDLTFFLYWIIFGLALTILSVMLWIVHRRVIRPLSVITGSFRDGRTDALNRLRGKTDEIGTIARLTHDYLLQRGQIETEIAERAKAEESLRLHEAELQSIFRAAPVGIGIVAGRVIQNVNERLCQMIGYASAELINKSARMLYSDQETFNRVGEIKFEQIRRHGIGIVETTWKRKDGSLIQVLLSSSVLNPGDPSGGIIFTALDITEHRATLEKLRESETEFRTLFESTQDAVMILDKTGFTDCNPATLKIFGCTSKDQFVGHHPSQLSPPEQPNGKNSMDMARSYMLKAVAEGRCFFEWVHRRTDGTDFNAEVLLSAMELKGKPLLQAVVRDITGRKQAENMIRESESKYHALVDHIGEGIAVVDDQERFTFVNPAACDIFGVPEDILLGKSIEQFVTNDTFEKILVQTALRRKGMKTSYELDIIRPDNEYRYLLATVTPRTDEQGGFVGSFAILLDITDRKKVQEALRKTEDRYKQITDHMLDMVSRLDENGNLTYISPSHRHILGYRPEDMIGRSYLEFIHPDDGDRFLNAIHAHIKNHKTVKLEFRFQHIDGHYMWLEAVGNPLISSDLTVTGSVFATRDITQRKSMEEALRESRQMLQLVLDTIPVGVFWKNKELTYLGCNRKFAEDYRRSNPLEIMGKTDFDICPSESDALHFQASDRAVMESGQPRLNYEELHITRDDKRQWVRTSKIPLRNLSKDIIGVMGVYEDITEQKEAELFLRESEEKYRRLVELSPWPIAIHKDGKIQYINQAGAKLMGCLSPMELLNQPLVKFIHPDYQNIIQNRIKTMNDAMTEAPVMEEKFVRTDQAIIDVEVAAIPFTQKGETYIQVMIRDITDRKRAETALINNEAKLRKEQQFTQLLLDTSPAFIVAIGSDGNTRMMNRALLEALEYKPEEVLGKDYLRTFVSEEDRPAVMDIFIDILENDRSTVNENRILSKSGKTYLVEWHGRLAVSKDEQEHFFVGVGTDITRRKAAEEALRKSEEQYRSLVENIRDGVYRSTPDGKFLEVNPAMVRIFGYKNREDMLRIDIARDLYFSPDDRAKQYPDTRDYQLYVFRLKRKDGSEIWVEENAFYVRDEKGQVIYHEGIVRDVTDRKKAEDALILSEKRYRDLVDQSLGYICIHDMNGVMTLVNPASAHALNYEPEELTGLNISDILVGPFKKRLPYYLETIREKKSYSGLMHVADRLDHRKIWMFNNRLYEDENRQPYVLCHAQDITELEKNRKEREQLIKELQNAIHKVRTLSGLLPICAACKKIRDDKGYWNLLENFITDHSEAEFTHGICPDCQRKLYPELYSEEE